MKRYNFTIPGIKETETTLAQPLPLRLVPWLLIIMSLWSLIFVNIPRIWPALRHGIDLPDAYTTIFWALLDLGISFYLAARIKRGDLFFVRVVQFYSLIALIGFVGFIIQIFIPGSMFFMASDLSMRIVKPLIFSLITLFILWVLTKYRSRIVTDGESYKSLPGYDAKKDQTVHRLGIIVFVILILYYLGTWASFAFGPRI